MKCSHRVASTCPGTFLLGRLLVVSFLLYCGVVAAQDSAENETTVRYPADFFVQWNPVTVADMIARIPGVSIALEGNENRFQQNDRGLGGSESILINGRRLSGKDNDAAAQLSRISFDQVAYIEIIRGTSSELVGGAQFRADHKHRH
jgi:outer membrane receptor for ferrienterochelin and colicins